MSKQQEMRAALDSRLAAMPDLPPVAWENSDFTPVPGQPYAAVNLLPRAVANPTLSQRLRDDGGVYQIGLYFPRGTDTATCDNLAGAVQSWFNAGLILQGATIKVQIERTPEIAAGMPADDRWLVPVSVRYRSLS
jgi:hypothetical protein